MCQTLRFEKPECSNRPRGAYRFEVWSPKLRRGLTLYGEIALKTWVYIESIPDIAALCERPITFKKSEKSRRVVDFWVQWPQREEMWILLRPGEQKHLKTERKLYSEFQSWSENEGLNARLITPDLVRLNDAAMQNWSTILHCLSANYNLISHLSSLESDILKHCQQLVDLQTLQKVNNGEDPVIIQAIVFSLLHRGTLVAKTLDQEIFNLKTEFMVR